MKEVGFCILFQVLKHLLELLEAIFRFWFRDIQSNFLPLNDEGKTLAGWQRGNLGKPSPATNVRDSTWIITKIILATSFGRFVVRFWYMLECLQIKYIEGWKRRRHKAYFYNTLHLKSRYAKNLTWVDRARHLQCLESKPRCRQLPCSALSPSVATVTNKLSKIEEMIRRW